MCLLATLFCSLNLIILRLEATRGNLASHNFFHERALSLFVRESAVEVLRWSFDYGTDLRIFWHMSFLVILLVKSLWIDRVSHAKKL